MGERGVCPVVPVIKFPQFAAYVGRKLNPPLGLY